MLVSHLRTFVLLTIGWLLLGCSIPALAQQNEADRKQLAEIRALAEKGDATAQFNLGVMYANGNAKLGADTAVELPDLNGLSDDQKSAMMAMASRIMQEKDAAKLKTALGRMEEAEGKADGQMKAFIQAQERLVKKRIEQLNYATGEGVTKDEVEAVKWYRKAADQGLAIASYNLGNMYSGGRGVAKDEAESLMWWRKAADQGHATAQNLLGSMYETGASYQNGGLAVAKDEAEAVKWYRKAADQGDAIAGHLLGLMYANGRGVAKDEAEAVRWYRKAADQGDPEAYVSIGSAYADGRGVVKDEADAVQWYRKVADRGYARAQYHLGRMYADGLGVAQDDVEAYKWSLLAGAQGDESARNYIPSIEGRLTSEQRAEGQRLARAFKPGQEPPPRKSVSRDAQAPSRPEATGSGFFITTDGFLVTNEHVVKNAAQVRLVTSVGTISAKVVKVDAANDLALLKAEGRFAALPVAASRAVKLGGTVATVGFPNIGLQGFAPKLAKGEIASLAGAQDDARYFQISVPVQPGNSGGALVDERGNVVGVVSAKLSARAALSATGVLPENVNYAVKSSYLLSFLESVPEVSAKLKEPETKERKFEDVVKSAEQAAVLVLVY